MRWESLRIYYEQYQSDDGKVALINHEGQLYCFKRNLSPGAIRKYLAMQEIGIGVKVVWYS
jgi:hypothetical protein